MRAFPTTMEVKEDVLFIQRVRPATTVTLPLNRIASFSVMEEENFMLKYHGQAISTSKVKGIKKYYLVINYDKGRIVVWGTAREYGEFVKLQSFGIGTAANIEL